MENERMYIEFVQLVAKGSADILKLDKNDARVVARDALICMAGMTIQQANEIVKKAGLRDS